MIWLESVYALMGRLTGGVALVNARDASNPRRWNNTVFWGIYAVTFLVGARIPNLANGVLVIAMVAAANLPGLGQGRDAGPGREAREASARRWGNRLFIPALAIPAFTLLGTAVLKRARVGGAPLVQPAQATLVALGIATVLALAIGVVMLRPPPSAPVRAARRSGSRTPRSGGSGRRASC